MANNPDRIFLSNDTVVGSVGDPNNQGFQFDEETFYFASNETSVHGGANYSAITQGLFTAKANGRIVDVWIGTVQPALSASGFVSGTVNGTVRINSVDVCSTDPSQDMVATSAGVVRTSTNKSSTGATSAVINQGSNTFSIGDQICYEYNTRSVGSAAAGAAGKGFYLGCKVRYFAR